MLEMYLWEFAEKNKGAIRISSINPGFVIGPVMHRDALSTTGEILKMINGSFNETGLPPNKYLPIDIRDVSDVAIQCLTDESSNGQRYLLSHKFQIGFHYIADVTNNNLPEVPIIIAGDQQVLTLHQNTVDHTKVKTFLKRPLRPIDQSIVDSTASTL